MKRALLFLAVAAVWSNTSLFAAAITFTNSDPRNDPNFINREWGARLRNFKSPESATMPVDNDDRENRFTGFAVANSSNENINVTLDVLDENGGIMDVLSPPELNPLEPLKQVAKFLHQYVPTRLRFKGSMVLVGQGGKSFAVVPLVQAQGLVTVIPVIPSKAPQIP